MIRAILTSGSMRSLRHKPDRSCATKPGHTACHRHLENDEVDRRARLSEKRASDFQLKPFATPTPGKAWGSSPFGVGLAAYDSRLLELGRSSDIHGTLDATKPRGAPGLLVAS